MKKFESSIRWLKSVLPPEHSRHIRYDWCWKELGGYRRRHNIPEEITEPIVQAIKDSGDIWSVCFYCLYVEQREDLEELINNNRNCRVYYQLMKEMTLEEIEKGLKEINRQITEMQKLHPPDEKIRIQYDLYKQKGILQERLDRIVNRKDKDEDKEHLNK